MTPADIDTGVWQEIARQVPATLAFLIISYFMISQFVKTNSKLTGQLMDFLRDENTKNSKALEGVAKSLNDMGDNIVRRLDLHDRDVEPKVLSAMERYHGQERRQGEGRRHTNGVQQYDQDKNPTTVVKHAKRKNDQSPGNEDAEISE